MDIWVIYIWIFTEEQQNSTVIFSRCCDTNSFQARIRNMLNTINLVAYILYFTFYSHFNWEDMLPPY